MIGPLVSVILPSYNAAFTIARSIDAILKQQYSNIEVLVIDDGSIDGTKAIINDKISSDSRVKFIDSKKNRGVVRARNLAIRLSKGIYVAFCDADDWWLPEKLITQVTLLQTKGATFSYAPAYYVEAETNWVSRPTKLPSQITYKRLLLGNPIGLSSAIFNQTVMGKIYFDRLPTPFIHEDYVYWLKLFKHSKLIPIFCVQPLIYVTIHKHTRSGNKWLAMRSQYYILNHFEGLSKFKSIVYVLTYVLFAFQKRGLAVWYRHTLSSYR